MNERSSAHNTCSVSAKAEMGTLPRGNAPLVTRTIDSQTLLQSSSTLHIRHQGELYRLQVTRQGKLILTK